MHDFIVVYAKKKKHSKNDEMGWSRNLFPRTAEQNALYKNPDNDPRGPWQSDNMTVKTYSKDYDYPIETPNGEVAYPTKGRCWFTSKERMKKLIEDNRIWFGRSGNGVPRIKRFLSEVQSGTVPVTWWKREDFGDNQEATQELRDLFKDTGVPFETPKPVRLIGKILQLSTTKTDNDIILDFFSGSATAAHSVLDMNKEDNGNRRFVMIQIDENIDNRTFSTICEVGKERIRRAGKKILEENADKEGIENLDVGFKVFKLDETNLKMWDEQTEDLEGDLFDLTEPVKEGRTQEDVLYEILLKYGIDLTVPIEEKMIAGCTVYSVGLGYLFICLERDLTLEQVEEIAKEKPSRIVFYDDSFKTDVVRTNAQQLLKRFGIEDIRVI